jgi:hypothetical protein
MGAISSLFVSYKIDVVVKDIKEIQLVTDSVFLRGGRAFYRGYSDYHPPYPCG